MEEGGDFFETDRMTAVKDLFVSVFAANNRMTTEEGVSDDYKPTFSCVQAGPLVFQRACTGLVSFPIIFAFGTPAQCLVRSRDRTQVLDHGDRLPRPHDPILLETASGNENPIGQCRCSDRPFLGVLLGTLSSRLPSEGMGGLLRPGTSPDISITVATTSILPWAVSSEQRAIPPGIPRAAGRRR